MKLNLANKIDEIVSFIAVKILSLIVEVCLTNAFVEAIVAISFWAISYVIFWSLGPSLGFTNTYKCEEPNN